MARLDDPTKHWKYNPRDVDERALWDDYQRAYEIALERCNTDRAVVRRAGRPKVVPQLGGDRLLIEHLQAMGLDWPKLPSTSSTNAGAWLPRDLRPRGAGSYEARVTTSPTTMTAGGRTPRSAARSAIVANVPTVSRCPGP